MDSKVTIRVRYACGAHQTNTVRGKRASSTSSGKDAARLLCGKLWPDQLVEPVLIARENCLDTFEATPPVDEKTKPQVAWCWASGLVEIGDKLPADSPDGGGAIQIATGPAAALKTRLELLARHGQGASDGQLLVPGVPEAETMQEKGDALSAWLKWCRSPGARDCVKFAQEFS